MSRKLISAQRPFKMLVPVLTGASDPSKGVSGNPVKKRETMTLQHFPEIPGRGPRTTNASSSSTPGISTRVGHVDYTTSPIPVASTGTITVGTGPILGATSILIGQFTLVTGDDVVLGQATGTATVVANPSTATLTVGGTALTDAAGARTPGSDDYDGTLGSAALIAADIVAAINDSANSFTSICTALDAGGGVVTLTAVAGGGSGDLVTLTTSDVADITVSGATFDGGGDGTATNLAAAVNNLPGYTGSALNGVVTVAGPPGPLGNEILFESGGASPGAFAFSPGDGSLGSAEPTIGPPLIT